MVCDSNTQKTRHLLFAAMQTVRCRVNIRNGTLALAYLQTIKQKAYVLHQIWRLAIASLSSPSAQLMGRNTHTTSRSGMVRRFHIANATQHVLLRLI